MGNPDVLGGSSPPQQAGAGSHRVSAEDGTAFQQGPTELGKRHGPPRNLPPRWPWPGELGQQAGGRTGTETATVEFVEDVQEATGQQAQKEGRVQEMKVFSPIPLLAAAKIGGRLKNHLPFWKTITSDPLILGYVHGVKLHYHTRPSKRHSRDPYPIRTHDDLQEMSQLLQKLESLGVIEPITDADTLKKAIKSPIFLTTNHDGSKRLILDTSEINRECLLKKHFKMDSLPEILRHVEEGDWFTSLDLIKGYFNVALDEESKILCCCEFQGKVYKFHALPMGITSAPRIFTALMKILLTHAREGKFRIFAFLDDTLVIGRTREENIQATKQLGDTLEKAGFYVHPQKSVLIPTQEIKFLGFIINSRTMMVQLPTEKVQKLQKYCRELRNNVLNKRQVRIRRFCKVIGFLISCDNGVPYTLNHFRSLEVEKESALVDNGRDYDGWMMPTQAILPDLEWWLKNKTWQKSFRLQQPTHRIVTDASTDCGWGAFCGSVQISGNWTQNESAHIGELELRAVLLALQQLPINFKNARIHLSIDNTVALKYVNKAGGRIPKLQQIAKSIWNLLEDWHATMHAYYIPSAKNPADSLSRLLTKSRARELDMEWKLDSAFFRIVCDTFKFQPEIDWFATGENTQLPTFASWDYDPEATFCDAFSQDWGEFDGYMFPPFGLISRALQKIKADAARTILIHPRWPSQGWWPVLTQLRTTHMPLINAGRILRLPGIPTMRHRLQAVPLEASLFLET